MTAWAFYAIGIPAPQGSKKHVGGGVMVESSKALKPWRDTIVAAAYGAGPCLEGPLIVRTTFTLPRPKSTRKTDRHPCKKPDVEKLARAAYDAITSAGLWHDDAQVARTVGQDKVWWPEDDALPVPGLVCACAQLDQGVAAGLAELDQLWACCLRRAVAASRTHLEVAR